MARDYYCDFPLWLPNDPAVLRLKARFGMAGAACYYELRAMLASAYQERRRVTADDLPAMAFSWHMGEDEVCAVVDEMAACGLVNAELWEGGVVGIEDVAERCAFKAKKAEAGRASGESRRARKESTA